MTPEQKVDTELLPTIGEAVDHLNKTYEVTEVEWDREEDVLHVTYRRKYHDDGNVLADPFGARALGAVPTIQLRDSAGNWLNRGGG